MAEVLQLLVDGVVDGLQRLAEREELGLETLGGGGMLGLGASDVLKLSRRRRRAPPLRTGSR
eukprot:14335935-Alexandrium_andersonii.AAC.1